MRFHGLLELSNKIKEIDNGLEIKNVKGISKSAVKEALPNVDERTFDTIYSIISSYCKEKYEVDDEVRKILNRLSELQEDHLDRIWNCRLTESDEAPAFPELVSEIVNFDNGYKADDYKKIVDENKPGFTDIVDNDNLIRLAAIQTHAEKCIKKAENKIAVYRQIEERNKSY